MHPTYQTMIEVDRAQRSIFAARYLRDRDLQREINASLNIMESWNQANAVIFYGKDGDLASNRREEQQLSVLALRVLQAALVYVNTLMVQEVLAESGVPHWPPRTCVASRRCSGATSPPTAKSGSTSANACRSPNLGRSSRRRSKPPPFWRVMLAFQ
jgi:hypothetical protein